MLSRVAENVYWMARYVERAEDTSRLINSMTNLLLDLPRNSEVGWYELIKVTGFEQQFNELHPDKQDERTVMHFLICDSRNEGSIAACVNAARENGRVTRELIPYEVWEQLNELYHYTDERAKASIGRRKRDDFMRGMIRRCQTMTGILMGVLTHDAAYHFQRLGRNLERADMSSRIIDVAAANLLVDQETQIPAYATVRWINVLKSLNAFQAYRLQGHVGVRGPDVLNYLFHEPCFPRSMAHCLDAVADCLKELPNPRVPRRYFNKAQKRLDNVNTTRLSRKALHRFIDHFQIELAAFHQAIEDTYFRYE
jgi:uncharacterized alpha-E superfamily protein